VFYIKQDFKCGNSAPARFKFRFADGVKHVNLMTLQSIQMRAFKRMFGRSHIEVAEINF
jgi:hypothetical protein